jgi:ABC-2 type transport system ATP-binding protein
MALPAESSTLAIETQGLRKEFDSRVAVSDLTLAVRRGEIFGFLGPNGAGKSTSIKMLLGLVRPTQGEAFVLGERIGDVDIRRQIGYLPEDFRFYDWLTATELLELHGRLAGLSAPRARARTPEVLELVGLTPHGQRRLRGFSKGMLQRLGLAQALIHEPRVLFLDEPTSGLDPMGRRLVRDIIRSERDRGTTVFLNSHLLSEVEVTCDRVAFINDGHVVASRHLRDAPASIQRVKLRARNLTDEAIGALRSVSMTPIESVSLDEFRFEVRSPDVLPDVVRNLVACGADVFHLALEPTSLEDLFVRLVGEDRGL